MWSNSATPRGVSPRGVVDITYYRAMSSKLDYLQKYMSKEERADGKSKKGKKKVKKRSKSNVYSYFGRRR